MKLVIGGSAGCGKSTLAVSLSEYLVKLNGLSVGLHEIDVYSDTHACIRGEKCWSKRKRKVKAWYNPTIKRAIEKFSADESDIVIGDLPGKITNPFLPKMVAPADQALVVFRSGCDSVHNWANFFKSQKIPILTYVVSDFDGQMFLPLNQTTSLTPIPVRGLSRSIISNPDIANLANCLLEHIRSGRT